MNTSKTFKQKQLQNVQHIYSIHNSTQSQTCQSNQKKLQNLQVLERMKNNSPSPFPYSVEAIFVYSNKNALADR